MAVTRCHECGGQVSTSAKVCPHCGVDSPALSRALMKVALLVVVVVGAFAFLYGSRSPPEEGTTPCAADFTKCVDNSDMVHHYSKMLHAKVECQIELGHSIRFGDPEWGWTLFESFRGGAAAPKSGVIMIIDENVKIPNAFGGKVNSSVECWYDFNTGTARIVSVSPRNDEIAALRDQLAAAEFIARRGTVASAASQAPGRDRLSPSGLPDAVAGLPAVIALQRNDPAAFARFNERFAEIAANAPQDVLPSLARAALRKSLKRQLANSSADTLLEITQVYFAYMQALQSLSPESCVALSDDSKGANLTVNLAQQLPVLFGRELAILERVASVDPGTAVAAPTAAKAQLYINTL
jgi:hypothetical protein